MSPRFSDLLLRSQSDERLVSLARAGHDRAFAAIVQRYRPELLALARRLSSDGQAEDLLQQAFLSAFTALRSGADVQHLRGWLYQIVRNAATKARATSSLPLDEVDIVGEPLEDTVLQRARVLAAMSELARLPERQRSALVGTALGGRAHADVAVSMGISEHAVRQLVHRARTTLRGAVTALTPVPLVRWLASVPSGTPPDVVFAAGAVSSTGLAVKLGALFAATGVLATGVVVAPLGHQRVARPSRSAVGHASRAHAAGVVPTARSISIEAARAPVVRREMGHGRSFGNQAGARGMRAAHGAGRGGPPISVPTATVRGGGAAESVTDDRGSTAVSERHEDSGPSGSRGQSGRTSSEGSGSGSHDGHADSGSSGPEDSGSGGPGPGATGGSSPAAGESGGDALPGHDGASAASDDGGTSGASVAGSAVTSDGSDGGSSSADGHSGAGGGSDSDSSSIEGK